MAEMSRHDLFLRISQNLKDRESRALRTYVESKELLPGGDIEHMNPQEIFVKLEHKLKLPKGDLSLLADMMKKIGRDDLAKEAEKIAEQERRASKRQKKSDRPSDSSDDTLAVPLSKRPRFGDKSAKLTTAVDVTKHFDTVIEGVSHNWDGLAKELGLTQNQIKGLRNDTNYPGHDRKCREVLWKWKNKHGSKATLQVLCEALINIDEGDTAELLDGGGAGPTSTDQYEEPSGGSTADRPTPRHQERSVEPEAGGDAELMTDEGDGKIAVKVEKCDDDFWDKTRNEKPYRMDSRPRGYALVLNNKNFTKLPYRGGAGIDLSNITALLEGLSFETQVLEDKKAEEIKNEVRKFSQRNHRRVDCCVVVLMSHGDEGVIYGTDDIPVQLDDIFAMFDNKNCRSLIDKPKLFLVQACRGTKVDKGVAVPEDQSDSSAPSVNLKREMKNLLHLSQDESDGPGVTPTRTDMLCGYATQLGYKSFRNTEHGSWFIQAITEVFMKQAKNKSLVQMMTQVTADVSKRTASCPGRPADHGGKEEAEFLSKLHKPLYFFPGD